MKSPVLLNRAFLMRGIGVHLVRQLIMGTRPSAGAIQKWFYFSGAVLFSSLVLYLGKSLFIPLGYAFFISIVLYPSCHYLEGKGVNRSLAITIGLLMVTLLFAVVIMIFGAQLQAIFSEWPLIKEKLSELFNAIQVYLMERYNISDEKMLAWVEELTHNFLGSSMDMLKTSVTSLMVNIVMLALIPVYTFLILFYRHRLAGLVMMLIPDKEGKKISDVMRLSIRTYFRFIKGMIFVYAAVGTLNSIGLLLMGIPHPFLFGYLTAIMTFIPYLGIIVSSVLPITYAWITYGTIWYPLGVVALFTFVQYLEANIIFPWAVGQRLELNTLSTLIVIILGGLLWGASGMILFIPFAAILKLVADRIPGWEPLSVFLSNNEPGKEG